MSVHSLMVGRLMLVLILAQATTDLLADDECLDDVCALHALQTKAHLQQAVEGDAERVAELKEKLPSCVTVTVGTCHIWNCAASRGPTVCKSGSCMCAPGFCSDGYKCASAPTAAPLSGAAENSYSPRSAGTGNYRGPAQSSATGQYSPRQYSPSQAGAPNMVPNMAPTMVPTIAPNLAPNMAPAMGAPNVAPAAPGAPAPTAGASNPWAKFADPKIWSDPNALKAMYDPSVWQKMMGGMYGR